MNTSVISVPDAAVKILELQQCGKSGCDCIKSNKKGIGKTHCPIHQDPTSSLNVSIKNSKLLVHCHAGCEQDEIVDFFVERDMWPSEDRETVSPAKQIVATYNYFDPEGTLLYQSVRFSPKGFAQRRPDGKGGWIWNMDGIQRVPYRLPELLTADKQRLRFVVEGEKDVETMERHGMLATTNVGGASKWSAEFSDALKDTDVVVLPDNDSPGYSHANQVTSTLNGVANRWWIIDLPHLKEHGDVTDWLNNGGSPEILRNLIKTTKPFTIPDRTEKSEEKPVDDSYIVERDTISRHVLLPGTDKLIFSAAHVHEERTGIHAKVTILMGKQSLAWTSFNVERDEDRTRLSNAAHARIKSLNPEIWQAYSKTDLKAELDSFCAGMWDTHLAQSMPELMEGSLNPSAPSFALYPFILTEGGTIIFAPPGRGKSYTMILMAVCVDTGLTTLWTPVKKLKVLFINLERGPKSVADRLGNVNAALGLPRNRPLPTINARGRTLTDVANSAERYIREHDIDVVFVDSISRAGAGDLKDDVPVNKIADTLNGIAPSWVALAHTPRADESHLYGSVMFEAAADCVVQLLSEQDEDGPLGIGLQITKQNDIGKVPLWAMALEFCDTGLEKVRHARPGEFIEIEKGRKLTMRDSVIEYLRDVGTATATQIAEYLAVDRSNVSRLLNMDKKFVQVAKTYEGAFYGLAQ